MAHPFCGTVVQVGILLMKENMDDIYSLGNNYVYSMSTNQLFHN